VGDKKHVPTVDTGGKGKYGICGCSVVCVLLLTPEQAALPKVKFGVFFTGGGVPAPLFSLGFPIFHLYFFLALGHVHD